MTSEIEIYLDNPETRCPVVLLLDTSSSMNGKPIEELNKGVIAFQQALIQDELASKRVEVAIVTFDSSVKVVQDFITVDQFHPPSLSSTGTTAMGEGIEKGLNLIESQKAIYKKNGIDYFRPWVLLITDGAPTDSWQNAAQTVQQFAANKKVNFYAIGVQGANMNILSQIAPHDTPPQMLNGLAFTALFKWLGNSLTVVSHSQPGTQIALPPTSGWATTST